MSSNPDVSHAGGKGRIAPPPNPPPQGGREQDSTRRPWSLAVRLTVWYAAAAFALVLVATGYLYWALANNLDKEDDQFLIDKVTAVRRVLEQQPGDRAALDQYVQAASTGRLYLRVRPDRDRNTSGRIPRA